MFNNFIQNPLQATTDWLKNLFPIKPTPSSGMRRDRPAGTGDLADATMGVGSYQVKPTDTDLNQIATNLGVPLNDLVAANNGRRTRPPVGSYISTGGPKAMRSPTPVERDDWGGAQAGTQENGFVSFYRGVDTALQNIINNQRNSPVYPAYAQSVANAQNAQRNQAVQQYIQGEKNYSTPVNPASRVTSQSAVNEARNQQYAANAIMQAVGQYQMTGVLPPSTALPNEVSLETQAAIQYTPEAMQALGYVSDGTKWVKGTMDVGSGQSAQRNVNGQIVNWNPQTAQTDVYGGEFVQAGATRWVRDSNGKLSREVASGGKWRTVRGGGGGRQQPTPTAVIAEAANAPGTAQTGINLKQGSG